MRRHTAPGFASDRSGAWWRRARDLGVVALTFVVGYVVSSYYVSPRSVGGDGGDHAVPRVIGQPLEQARSALASAGFRSRLKGERPGGSVPRGGVIWQDPPAELVAAPNAIVELVVSAGPAPVTVPDVIGFALPTAEKVVEAAGIRVGRIDTVHSAAADADVVIATRPAPGNGRPRGAAVDLVVSGTPRRATAGAPAGGVAP